MEQPKQNPIEEENTFNLEQIQQETNSIDQKIPKKKVKNIKINSTRRTLNRPQRIESNNFNDPIYAGLEDQVFNKEEHNFGPWIGNQHLRQPSRQRKKVVRIVERQPVIAHYNPDLNQYVDFRNWESTLRTHYVPSQQSSRNPYESETRERQRMIYLQSPLRNPSYLLSYNPNYNSNASINLNLSPNLNSNSHIIGNSNSNSNNNARNSLPSLNINFLQQKKNKSIQNMRFSSTQIFKNTQQISKGRKSPNKINSEMKIANGVKIKGKYGLNIPFVSLDCQKPDSPSKISKVVYNYCYDDDLISSRITPDISKIAQINMRNQMLEKLKKQLKVRNSKTNTVMKTKSKSQRILNLYKAKNK